MPRAPRLELPGVPLHILQRGNNRTACFFGDVDRRFYLKCLAEYAERRGVAIHAYVLMSNHVHLLATPSENGAAGAMMQDIGRQYVRAVNNARGRTGTLWEGRFKSSVVDSERYLLACHRYIELNPVRAGIVDQPRQYAWSSHTYYTDGERNGVVTPHSLYLGLAASPEERHRTFRALFVCHMEEGLLRHIRAAINTCAALGSRKFMEEVAAKLGQPVRELRPGKVCSDPFRGSDRSGLL